MCNRFALPASPEEIAGHFELAEVPQVPPRYNIAPGEEIFVVRNEAGSRRLDRSAWGLSPSWIHGRGKPLLNVRAEMLRGKSGRSEMARQGRCLVPAGGFYEWRRVGRLRQPFYYRLKGSRLLGLAAVSELVTLPEGVSVRHCAIVTTTPNALVAEVHDRMPVIIPREAYGAWLDPAVELAEIMPLLQPFPAELMTAYAVSTVVNRAGVEDPRSIEPAKSETLF